MDGSGGISPCICILKASMVNFMLWPLCSQTVPLNTVARRPDDPQSHLKDLE